MSRAVIATNLLIVVANIATLPNMEPAAHIISLLGGDTKVGVYLGTHRTQPAKWKQPKEKGGTGGVIPIRHVRKLLAMAEELGVELAADDFLPLELEAGE